MKPNLQAQHDELMRLASVLATKRCRRLAAYHKQTDTKQPDAECEAATHALSLAITKLLEEHDDEVYQIRELSRV